MKQVTINNGSLSLTALNYGAVIQKLMVPDREARLVNVVVGLDHPEEYLKDKIALGASVGRFAGRISGGGFNLNDQRYELFQFKGIHLHGGKEGFAKKYWKLEEVREHKVPEVTFSYKSEHLEEGYPGELQVKVSYKLHKNGLGVHYEAVTDRPTIVNLTNHSYFVLDQSGHIDRHHLTLNCPAFLETDKRLLPTGKLLKVDGTELDFRQSRTIGEVRMDTPFVCERDQQYVGELFSEDSGIRMRIWSNQPAVVVYTPMDFPSICFETQNYPDAPNFRAFPTAVLNPGETYSNTTVFEFDLVN